MICPYCNQEMVRELNSNIDAYYCRDNEHLTYFYNKEGGHSLFVDRYKCAITRGAFVKEYKLLFPDKNDSLKILSINISPFEFKDSYKALQTYFNLKAFI